MFRGMAKQHRKYYDSKGRKLSLAEYLQRGLARADQIIALDKMLMPHAEIAERIGVTEERVKQVLREYRKRKQ